MPRGSKRGRQKKYTPEQFEQVVARYFEEGGRLLHRDKDDPDRDIYLYTISGLCLYCGISRELLSNYGTYPEYCDAVKNARERIENNLEELALMGVVDKTVSIFSLKNNFGWRDTPKNDDDMKQQIQPKVEVHFEEASMTAEEIAVKVSGTDE